MATKTVRQIAGIKGKIAIDNERYTCEYDVGTKKVLLILEIVFAYCGSPANFFHSGSATKADHP